MSYCNVPFPAPATQSHAPTLPGTSIDCACHQMSHWCCACHTTSHCNAPFPAPAMQSHAPTLPPNVALVLRLPRNVTLQRTCNVFPAPATQTQTPTLPGCFNRLRLPPNVTRVLRLPHNVTLQRTLPCSSHPDPNSNATRMLQSTAPATKCHTGVAPQRHTATHPSLHQPPRATLQRYQDASITCHQMSHWCCACHTTSHCNVPSFPAPATQSHAPTLPGCFNRLRLPPNVTLVLRLPHNVTIQRTIPCTSHNVTCTSEPAPADLQIYQTFALFDLPQIGHLRQPWGKRWCLSGMGQILQLAPYIYIWPIQIAPGATRQLPCLDDQLEKYRCFCFSNKNIIIICTWKT